jgi:hypothetical protein
MLDHLTPGTRCVGLVDLSKLQGYTPQKIRNDHRPLIYNHYLESSEPTYHVSPAHHQQSEMGHLCIAKECRLADTTCMLPLRLYTCPTTLRISTNSQNEDYVARIASRSEHVKVTTHVLGTAQCLFINARISPGLEESINTPLTPPRPL